jgi:hypothetical protein
MAVLEPLGEAPPSPNEVDVDRLVKLGVAEATRQHLLDNWEYARRWRDRLYGKNGSPCFLQRAFQRQMAGTGSFYERQLAGRAYGFLTHGHRNRSATLRFLNAEVVRLGGRPLKAPGPWIRRIFQ